jgi:hypothetical protein
MTWLERYAVVHLKQLINYPGTIGGSLYDEVLGLLEEKGVEVASLKKEQQKDRVQEPGLIGKWVKKGEEWLISYPRPHIELMQTIPVKKKNGEISKQVVMEVVSASFGSCLVRALPQGDKQPWGTNDEDIPF